MIQADSGNERYQTCTGAIREAPRRKEKMKKTIAILLILVIGMVGVFAADENVTTLKLKTEIAEILHTKLVAYTATPVTTKAAFEALGVADVEGVTAVPILAETGVLSSGANANIGTLYIMTNHKAGYTLTLTGSALASAGNSGQSPNGVTTVIDYILTAGDTAKLDTKVPSNSKSVSSGAVSVLTVTPYAVGVTLNSTDFDAAQAANDYTATVTFTFTAGA